ncbi:MAG: twin-arginine translocation signal domain-containing protein, partial [Alphaproteobacteria bacterium]|nr:twin-arginine translocation signal domain-containing protein [Alphaproteobacteria bacterium]
MNWDRMQNMLRQGRIGRRDFMAGAAALGVAAANAESVLAQTQIAQTPKRGGHLRFGLNSGSTTDSLDPTVWRAEFMHTVGPQLHDSLVRVDENVTPQPALGLRTTSPRRFQPTPLMACRPLMMVWTSPCCAQVLLRRLPCHPEIV